MDPCCLFVVTTAGTVFDSFVYFQRTASATCQSPRRRGCHGLPRYRKYLTSSHRYLPVVTSFLLEKIS